ncbi:hypothetical protein PV325_012235 [Microctonus aethiopoides]|uniref:DNA mismatch repair protein n=1 Tax=Microctonus aethiopoides TaxID=144406 RepID=A0AA39F7S0_9HYME|nr:hypothetical protein PV325_012235 [Microctonus aethiopoides]KAK0164495.1 hypothetical protein PV328_003118 [Microctonus aethiopoides]
MSKQNTLYNYFKSPKAVDSKAKDNSELKCGTKPTTPKRAARGKGLVKDKENKAKPETPKRKRPVVSKKLENTKPDKQNKDDETEDQEANEEVEDSPIKPKRRRIIIPEDDSGDSEDDYKPDPDETVSESDYSDGVESSDLTTETETDDEPTPKKSRRVVTKSTGKLKSTKSESTTGNNDAVVAEAPTATGRGSRPWPHLTFDFLQPENIRDANRRRPDHPDYNPKTLYVSPDFLDKQTPAMRQWWVLKSQHYDCVLFFKVGKFYELYHMDAVIGASELNMNYMSGEWAHSGFPEAAYARFVGILVEKGYKVARIEQTETPDMMSDRCKTAKKVTKFDKVVRREICQISNQGTRVRTVQDDQINTPYSNYLLSIVEKTSAKLPTYGVCFIDTSIGVFHLGQFEDDISNSRLLTLLSHYNPAQIIYERGNLSRETMKIINNLPSTTREALQKEVEFFSATDTLKKLHEGEYFKYETSDFSWPEGLKPFLNQQDNLGITPAEDKELAVNALGGCLYVLISHVLDEQILAQKKFETYLPPDMTLTTNNDGTESMRASMVLDAATINNLMILGKDDSLLKTLDYCCTPFGKRLLREWVCRPSCRKNTIISRQDAITELLDYTDIVQQARKKLSELPDLERLLSKVHAHGNAARLKNHPDGRAIMFEPKTYAKRKIQDFITILQGFENVLKINELFESFESSLICQITKTEPAGRFPDLLDILKRFKNGFNHEEAQKAGCIVPKKGMDPEYDEVAEELEQITQSANAYLKKQSKHFGTQINFATTSRHRYQIDVPDSKSSLAGNGYELEGSRKGFKRYSTSESINLVEQQTIADEKREKVLKDVNRRAFANFSKEYDMWTSAVYNIAVLDALISLTEYAKSGEMCVPELHDNSDEIIISIKDGRHPCIISEKFVPNDTMLGTDDVAPLVIVTGPNMGGKSTLMRQVGLLTIMAHIGCHIPADSCKLSLVDRIFTRLGAGDDILTCRSTFLVELTETSIILRHVTKHSLVLLDELGRGTSTYDGTAIAASVIDALSKVKCRTLFSTHYHSLVDDFHKNPNVSLAHMACQVENEEEDEVTEEAVTFLYKFIEGACPKSYGFNAARLAGIPLSITKRAHEIAEKLQRETNRRKIFIKLWKADNKSLENVITGLQNISV